MKDPVWKDSSSVEICSESSREGNLVAIHQPLLGSNEDLSG